MNFQFACFIILVASIKIATGQNYCNQSLCGGRKHIACNNTGNFASSCINATMIQLTQEQKNFILNEYNSKRNLVAGGGTSLPVACRMATMEWDNELATFAELNVKQCQLKHDACHNTNAFRQTGQNLVLISYNQGGLQVPRLLQKGINLWFRQIKDVQTAHILSFPKNYIGRAIGHFSAMMTDRNIRVGCAASTYKKSGTNTLIFLMACNYATTNVINKPTYNVCSVAASGCTTGPNPAYPNLCSATEKYVVNL